VIVNGQIEHLGRIDELAREPDVLAARFRIAARMVVDEDHGRDTEKAERRTEDLAWADQGRR
jgi:hypothetical protein